VRHRTDVVKAFLKSIDPDLNRLINDTQHFPTPPFQDKPGGGMVLSLESLFPLLTINGQSLHLLFGILHQHRTSPDPIIHVSNVTSPKPPHTSELTPPRPSSSSYNQPLDTSCLFYKNLNAQAHCRHLSSPRRHARSREANASRKMDQRKHRY
jgi:hypothetical protein